MDRDQRLMGPASVRVARMILAATLLLGLLSGSVRFAAVSSASLCELACCLGRAPHAAGSCMGDSCNTSFPARATTTPHETRNAAAESEHLCGATHATPKRGKLRLKAVAMVGASSTQHSHAGERQAARVNQPSGQATVSSAALMTPCNPDCGSCASGSTGNKRPRNIATLSYADRARPPSRGRSALTSYGRIGALSAQCPQLQPRAPPVLS